MHLKSMISHFIILGVAFILSTAIVIDPETANVTDPPTDCEAYCTNKRGTPYCCRYIDEDGNERTLTEEEKPGECRARRRCPEGKRNTHYCEVDIDCPGRLKCCSDGCGSLPVCRRPRKNKKKNRRRKRPQRNKEKKGTPEEPVHIPSQQEPPIAANPNVDPGLPIAGIPNVNPGVSFFPALGAPSHGAPQSQPQNGGGLGILGQVFQGLNNAGINFGFGSRPQGFPALPSNQPPSPTHGDFGHNQPPPNTHVGHNQPPSNTHVGHNQPPSNTHVGESPNPQAGTDPDGPPEGFDPSYIPESFKRTNIKPNRQ